jgi:ADP-L-glycero-D-manno-heptose 6-epimerase
MKLNDEIIITGAAGFIGSCMASYLQKKGFKNLILVDDFSKLAKKNNFEGLKNFTFIERDLIENYLKENTSIKNIIHFGARTDTTEQENSIFEKLNINFSKILWQYCSDMKINFIYASSAATYGDGNMGYDDDEKNIPLLKPLNPYGNSKQVFDEFVLQQVAKNNTPNKWAGLKFFNVYGPNEFHKNRMASVIFHAFNQIKKNNSITLFKSHKPEFKDGEQKRDFIYVKDILQVTEFILDNDFKSGIYNLGSGNARTFNDLAIAIFNSLNLPFSINYIDTPIDIRASYQYFTEAKMEKLKSTGYDNKFYSIEDGVEDYVKNYLMNDTYF